MIGRAVLHGHRPPIALMAAALLLLGCVAWDPGLGARITYQGQSYSQRGYLVETIPAADITLIGRTDEASTDTEAVEYAEVYAIAGLDPGDVVAVILHWEGIDELVPVSPAPVGKPAIDTPNLEPQIFLREGLATLPSEACRYYDPDAEGTHGPLTPEECR